MRGSKFMHSVRLWVVTAVTVLSMIGSVFLVPVSVGATGENAKIGMPFAGKWAWNGALVNPPYTDANSSHPTVHSTVASTGYLWGDWATDLYPTSTNVAVKLQVSSDPAATYSWLSLTDGNCGQRTGVNVIVNGTNVGSIYFEHLNNAVKSGAITNGMTLGYTKNWGACNGNAEHVHFELNNAANYACFTDYGHPGTPLNQGDTLGVLGGTNTGTKQACTSSTTSTLTVGSPSLSFEAARRVPGGTRVQGWSADPDSAGAVMIHSYAVNGEPLLNGQPNGTFGAGYADLYRADVGNHAFDIFVPTGPGVHKICVYALNNSGTQGATTKVCINSFTVSADPVGNAEVIELLPGRNVRVAGWALDRDLGSPVILHVYYGNTFAKEIVANIPRVDVGAAFPYYGDNHGFDGAFPMPAGTYNVCVYVLNGGGTAGANQLLKCQVLTMT